ncbi:Mv-ORF117 peptide [Maruca vitrata nucleopolyhedrovirus]|uniref:Mv-ORF117 peptide n=1 Tax=Maruca vitrata nucleopolyhedrovirus TaxID=1307954 RepID=A1YRH9_9ABAC|nr:Mv-ORF117 peptide [Maruca vitrata nucleopolyhedrovirus]ABM05433.1 Mv-ORF117 peptide [Maruca vitrata nucleopolyhedrovirus]
MKRFHPYQRYQRAAWSASILKKNNIKDDSKDDSNFETAAYTTAYTQPISDSNFETTYTTAYTKPKAKRKLDFNKMEPLPCNIDDGSLAKPLTTAVSQNL